MRLHSKQHPAFSSGLVHTVVTTPANTADVEVADELLHRKRQTVWADAGYTGADKRMEADHPQRKHNPQWVIARKRGKIKAKPEGPARPQTGDGNRGARQGADSSAGRASVLDGEGILRLYQGSLQGPSEEHRPGSDPVRAGESAPGAKSVARDDRVSASGVSIRDTPLLGVSLKTKSSQGLLR
jgi:hypothetical protein